MKIESMHLQRKGFCTKLHLIITKGFVYSMNGHIRISKYIKLNSIHINPFLGMPF